MKTSQFRKLINEEVRKVLKENRLFQKTMVKDPLNITLPAQEQPTSVQDKHRIKQEIEAALTKAFQEVSNKYGQHLSNRSFVRCSWYGGQPTEGGEGGSLEISSMIKFI